jgi:hypothetical protein
MMNYRSLLRNGLIVYLLEAQFQFAPDTSMPVYQATVEAAQSVYRTTEANAVLAAFQDRQILP